MHIYDLKSEYKCLSVIEHFWEKDNYKDNIA